MKHLKWVALLGALGAVAGYMACQSGPAKPAGSVGLPEDASKLATERNLSPDDVYAALKTYLPSGQTDPYMMFSSGGHSGQIHVIGIPSMRLLRTIAVFAPEPWQGYGYAGGTLKTLEDGYVKGHPITWGDTHHPALSETNGDYDGEFLFINDKANARVAVISLKDFETKQIIKNPNAINDHGGAFVTPNTEYVIESPQYGAPIGYTYAPLSEYKEKYRGFMGFWSFDRVKGRIDIDKSFQIEVPPYWQDLCDAGKGPSYGLAFCNSFNTELAIGGVESGNPPFEAGTTKNDTDFLHIVDWKKAEAAVAAGKAKKINGIMVLPLEVAAKEGILFFAPEPKSPHGADVTPGGEYLVVGGKLDPHVTIYSVEKMKAAMAQGGWATDLYGVPVIPIDKVMETQVELGLGPLHTVFDDKGYAYTSLFLDSAVARWTLGGPYASKHPEPGWTLVQKLPVQYNIGHIASAEGDTVSPDGEYVVALNKWSIDRFANVGPLLPQNFQLVDIAKPGESMKVLYDMAMGVAEPHYAQIIKSDKIKAWEVYPEIGWDPEKMVKDENAITDQTKARIERRGKTVEIWMTIVRSHYTPEHVELNKGDHVIWHMTNLERARDATHGFAISGYNIELSLEPGESQTIEFDASIPGTFTYYCTEFCSALHLEMIGYMLVKG